MEDVTNNIDKDIEIIRREQNEVIEVRDIVDEGSSTYNECEEFIQAVDNVLKELETYKKIVDLMAEYLADRDFDECCAEIPEPCLGCSWEDYEPHTNCIKEHFRNEVLKDE